MWPDSWNGAERSVVRLVFGTVAKPNVKNFWHPGSPCPKRLAETGQKPRHGRKICQRQELLRLVSCVFFAMFTGRGQRPCEKCKTKTCTEDWEYECPKLWESLSPTDAPNQRFCGVCRLVLSWSRGQNQGSDSSPKKPSVQKHWSFKLESTLRHSSATTPKPCEALQTSTAPATAHPSIP